MNGTVTNYAPEYEDCRQIATEHKVPLKTVMNEAMEAYAKSLRAKATLFGNLNAGLISPAPPR